MIYLQKKIVTLILLSSASMSFATSIFTINPEVSRLSVSSNGNTSALYTATNNSTATVPSLSILPNYLSRGNNLSLFNDTCSGTTLVAGGSCSFRVLIPGAHQPANFIVSPKVCGFNGLVCSLPSNSLNITVNTPLHTTQAYQVITAPTSSGAIPAQVNLTGINTASPMEGLKSVPLFFDSSTYSNVVVSKDGGTIYVAGNGNASYPGLTLDVLNVNGDNIQIEKRIMLSTGLNKNLNSNSLRFSMALTPNGSTLFITVADNNEPQIYRVDLSQDTTPVTPLVTNGNDLLSNAGIMTMSADGSTVYVTLNYSRPAAFSTTAASVDLTADILQVDLPADEYTAMTLDAGANILYLNDMTTENLYVVHVQGTSGGLLNTIPIGPGSSEINDMTVSSDGNFIYLTKLYDNSIMRIDLRNPFDTTSINVQNPLGIALTPNGEYLYASSTTDATYIISTKNFSSAGVESIPMNGKSSTRGNFIGP